MCSESWFRSSILLRTLPPYAKKFRNLGANSMSGTFPVKLFRLTAMELLYVFVEVLACLIISFRHAATWRVNSSSFQLQLTVVSGVYYYLEALPMLGVESLGWLQPPLVHM
jgi:hypothetical protein